MSTGGGAPNRYSIAGSAGGAAGVAGASNGGSTSGYTTSYVQDSSGFIFNPGPFTVLGANGQGPFPLSGFSQHTVAAGAGGDPSPSVPVNMFTIPGRGTFTQHTDHYRRGGGGGGGVIISGYTPAQSAEAGTSEDFSDTTTWPHDAWVTVGGQPGQGFGAGGGGGARRRGAGGQGASGVVYIEWSP
jgi:hypothetical protein